jgi:hypothetical protein
LRSKFQNIDRHCGYLIFHQELSGEFLLMREEENYLAREQEASIREKTGDQGVEKAWAQLSQFCP